MKIIDAAAALQLYTATDPKVLIAGLPDDIANDLDSLIRLAAISKSPNVTFVHDVAIAPAIVAILTALNFTVQCESMPPSNQYKPSVKIEVSWSSIILSH